MNTTHRFRLRREGFTLIEVSVATVIIAIGLTALMSSLRAGTTVNSNSSKMTTAMFLAQNVHEWALRVPFDTIHNEMIGGLGLTKTFSPPLDGRGSPVLNQGGWSQTVTLSWRNPDNLKQEVAKGASEMIQIFVEIKYQGTTVYTMGFLRVKPSTEAPAGGSTPPPTIYL